MKIPISKPVEQPKQSHPNPGLRIQVCGFTHVDPVAVSRVERVVREELDDVPEAGDLELFGLLLDDLAVEGVDERGRVEEHGAVGQVHLALPDGGEVVLGDAGLPDRPGREVQDLVVVGHDLEETKRETE